MYIRIAYVDSIHVYVHSICMCAYICTYVRMYVQYVCKHVYVQRYEHIMHCTIIFNSVYV